MKLFEFVKILFNNPKKYKQLNGHEIGKHRFMINRFMSIRYPEMANLLNINKINSRHLVDCWYLVASNRYNRTPGWIFTKVRKNKENSKSEFQPHDNTIKFYLKINEINIKDFKQAMKYYRPEILKELELLQKQIDVSDVERE